MVNPVFQDFVPPSKVNARAYLAYVMPSVNSVQNTTMQGVWSLFVRELDAWFDRDASDFTSPDDGGLTTIVGPAGERWKRVAGGSGFYINASGDTAGRDAFDDEPPPFLYYDSEQELAFVKNSSASGDWSDGFPIRGPAGEDGYTAQEVIIRGESFGDPIIPGDYPFTRYAVPGGEHDFLMIEVLNAGLGETVEVEIYSGIDLVYGPETVTYGTPLVDTDANIAVAAGEPLTATVIWSDVGVTDLSIILARSAS